MTSRRRALGTMTAWDAQVALRALWLGALALAVAWVVTASTDEGGLAWTVRAARVLPLAPLCAAAGTWLALVRGRARGETRALESLGRSPLQNAVAAVAGGAAIAFGAALVVLAEPDVDVGGFFPTVARIDDYRAEDAGFVDHARGFRIARDGALTKLPADPEPPSPAPPRDARAAAALATAIAGAAFPLLAARARRRSRAWIGVTLASGVALSIVLFHAAAARRVPVFAATIPSMMLLAAAAFSYRSPPWSVRRR